MTGRCLAAPHDPLPARVFTSIGFTPAATTFTRNSAPTLVGIGTSAAVSTSAAPGASTTTARIVLIPKASLPCVPPSEVPQ